MDALERHFQLQQQGVGVGDHRFVVFHNSRSDGSVRFSGDTYAVLPLIAHIDDGDTGRELGIELDGTDVDAIFGKTALHLVADGVITDAGDKGDGGAKAGGSDCLISPLATRDNLIAVTGQGFTRARKVGNAQHVVCIDTAQNDETIHVDYS